MKKLISTKLAVVAFFAILTLALLTVAYSTSFNHENNPIPVKPTASYVQGVVLVKYKPGASSGAVKTAIAGTGKIIKSIGPSSSSNIRLLKLNPGVSVEEAIANLQSNPNVEHAAPNYIRKPFYQPNDTLFSSQWGLHNTGQLIWGYEGTPDCDIEAGWAWELEKGNSHTVTIAVIDSGIDDIHPDLSSKLWVNSDEVADNGLDDDSNGYIDDRNGYNWAGISQYAYEDTPYDFGENDAVGEQTVNSYIAQSITGTGENLTHLGFLIRKVGLPPSDITVSVRDEIGTADLATLTIADQEVDDVYATIVQKQLSTPVTLTAGEDYFIVLKVSKVHDTRYYEIGLNEYTTEEDYEDPYVEGWMYENPEDVGWSSYDTSSLTANNDLFFTTNENSYPRDDNGHGTHVAGIAAASSNNASGVAGVSFGAKVMPLKAGDSAGYLMSDDWIEALQYAADNGAKVVNMSFGGEGYSSIEQDAVDYAYNKGVVLMAAAGNSGDSSLSYPASYSNVVSVGATDNQDIITYFSTYNSKVDVSAPGRAIVSSTPTYNVSMSSIGVDLNYDFLSGTSMASPMAAGTAALVRSKKPSYGPYRTELSLKLADDLGSSGKDNYYGVGRINAYKALKGDTVKPSTPSVSSSTHRSQKKYYRSNAPRFTWNSTDNLGIKGYCFTINKRSRSYPKSIRTANKAKQYRSLRSGRYYFHVRARDYFGNYSPVAHRLIRIDRYRPRTSARSSTIQYGQRARLYYRVNDPYTGGIAKIRIVITRSNQSGSVNLGRRRINRWSAYTLPGTWAPGRYRFYVYATDLAGNTQRNVASGVLTINSPPSNEPIYNPPTLPLPL